MLRDDGADAPLVRRIGVGVQQANRNSRDAEVHKVLHRLDHTRLVQGFEHRSVVAQTLPDFAHEMQGNEARRFDPEERIAVAVGNRLARDLDDVAEPRGHEQAEALEAVLQNGVGRRRGAVEHLAQHRSVSPGHVPNTVEETATGIVGRARGLDGNLRAGVLIDGNDVGEGPASVDRYAQAHDVS